MTAKHATRDILLDYLTACGEPRKWIAIKRYMVRFKVSDGATRTQLWRLCRAGVLERLEGDRYQLVKVGDE